MIIPKDAVIVSKDGEIIGELKQGDRVFKAKSIKILQGKAADLAYKPSGWTAVYTNALAAVIGKISAGTEMEVFLLLLNNLRRNTNRIAYKNGKVLTYKTIALALNRNIDVVKHTLTKFKKLGIVCKNKGAFVLNPYIAWSGKYTSKELTRMFENTEFEMCSKCENGI